MGIDLFNKNRDYAIYLPSISSVYCKYVSGYYNVNGDLRPTHPEGVPSFDKLDFLNKDEGIFNYSHALYSAGHAMLDLERTDQHESMVAKRDRQNTWIMGDSGGYQIASGLLKFPWDDIKGQSADKIRGKILNWLEHMADYSMLLDFPTRAIDNPKASLNSFQDCLDGSLVNLEYFLQHRKGNTKYLNVLQGRSLSEADVWFDAVKDYPFEGWAFGGFNMMDFEMMLKRLIQMRDGHYLEENSQGDKRNWLHFLGQSRLITSCAFTTLQRILRKQVDDNLRISFDSASAFIAVANGQVYTNNVFSKKRFTYLMEKMYDYKSLAGSDKPFPWESSVGERLTLGDICVKKEGYVNPKGIETKTSWDSYSYVLIMAHNVERHIKAIQQANQIYDLPHATSSLFIPDKLVEFKDIVHDIFESETPYEEIKKHHKFLNNFTGRRTGKGVKQDDLSDFFQFDKSAISNNDEEADYEDEESLLEVMNKELDD